MRHVGRFSSPAPGAGTNGGRFGSPPGLDGAVLGPLQWSELSALDTLIDRCREPEDGWTVHTLSRALVDWPAATDRALIGLSCEFGAGTVLAGVAGVAPDPSSFHDAHLSLLVDPRYRRQGIGGLLLEAVVELAAALGYRSVGVHAHDADLDCVSLLVHHGFLLSSRPGSEPLRLERALADRGLRPSRPGPGLS